MPLPWVQRLRVLCFVDLGIRSEEARLLQSRNFDMSQHVVVVKGKGDKERIVPFSDDLFRAFVNYRNRPIPNVRVKDEAGRRQVARPPHDDDYLFFPLGSNRVTRTVTWADPFRPMADRSVRSWWDRVCRIRRCPLPQPPHEPAHAWHQPLRRGPGTRDDPGLARPRRPIHDQRCMSTTVGPGCSVAVAPLTTYRKAQGG